MKKRIVKRVVCALTAALMLAGIFAFPGASGADSSVASFSSPAIRAEAGKTVDLGGCSVQFEYGGKIYGGGSVEWKDGDRVVTSFTPEKKGVYPLTASSGSLSSTVYVVAKDAQDADYVLYENDFSSDPAADLRTVQQTAGTTVSHDAAAGTLVLDGTTANDGYIRVLFPSFLDSFGDAIIEASLKLASYKSATSRWGSVMFRVQGENYPYMQAALRYNSAATNGCEIAERTQSNAWNVMTAASGSASNVEFNNITVKFAGTRADYILNGKTVITQENLPYTQGAIGLQVRGTKMVVDSIKVTLNPDSTAEAGRIAGGYADIPYSRTSVSLAPFIVTYDAGGTHHPEVSMFNATESDGKIVVENGGSARMTLEEAFDALGGQSIPLFRTASVQVARKIASFLKENDLRDAYILSDDTDVILAAKSDFPHVNGVIDYSSFSGEDPELLREAAVKAGARSVILPDHMINKKDVSFLQDRYLTCWAPVSGRTDSVRATNAGISALFFDSPASDIPDIDALFPINTLTRSPNVIGHRGVPSLAQENSVAGSAKAFELGASMVENDIHLSSDGVLVVMHDATIDRTTDGTGNIGQMTLKQISKFRIVSNSSADPEPIPTLEDYFKEFCHGEKIVIELKDNSTAPAQPLADLIKQYGMEKNIVVISFYESPINALRQIMPGVPAAYLNSSIAPDESKVLTTLYSVMDKIQPLGTVYSPSYAKGALGMKTIRAFMLRGVSTWIWTVNDRTAFDTYFINGVRGITTNYSQWVSDYYKSLDLETRDDGGIRITATTYAGETKDVTSAVSAVTVEGADGLAFDPETGFFTGDCDTAKVFFTLTSETSSASKYSLVTELSTVKVVRPAVATEITEPESTAAETAPVTETTTEAAPARGCGSMSLLPTIALLPATIFAIRKKKGTR